MKTLIGKVLLLNRNTGQYEDADLFCGFDEANLSDYVAHWKPIHQQNKAEDGHWDWSEKAAIVAANPLIHDIFVLECGGRTQGFMITCKGGEKCISRHPEHKRAVMIYIERIATAPWNRPELVKNPTYKGAGRMLLGAAVSQSIEEEMCGRVGLHSLPGSEQFYQNKAENPKVIRVDNGTWG